MSKPALRYLEPPPRSYGYAQEHVKLYSVYLGDLYNSKIRYHALGQQRNENGSLALRTTCGRDVQQMHGMAVEHAVKIAEPCRHCFPDGVRS